MIFLSVASDLSNYPRANFPIFEKEYASADVNMHRGSLYLGSHVATLGQNIFDRLNKVALISVCIQLEFNRHFGSLTLSSGKNIYHGEQKLLLQ